MDQKSKETSVNLTLRTQLRETHLGVLSSPEGVLPRGVDARMTFPYLLTRRALAFERTRAQCRRLYPASPQERLAIGTVWDIGPLTMSELARAISLSLPATSALVDRLVLRGFLERIPDETDRRRTNVSVTPLAMTSMDGPVFEVFARTVEETAGFDEATLQQVLQVMAKTYDVIDEMGHHLAAMSDDELHDAAAAWDAEHAKLTPEDDAN